MLTDAQWCMLDILMRARATGVNEVSRKEILYNTNVAASLRVQLVWAALTTKEYIEVKGGTIRITDAGIALFGNRNPTPVADLVILLPDLTGGPKHAH